MKLSKVYEIANTLAPKDLSDEFCGRYGACDNSGVLIDCDEELVGAVFSLDLTEGAIALAKERNANLIVTHHPCIYAKLSELSVSEGLSKKVSKCMRAGISVISMHLNLDAAEGGIDESLMNGILRGVGGEKGRVSVQKQLSCGGYGRAYDIPETDAETFERALKKEFSSESVRVYAKTGKTVKRVASFCGSGVDEEALCWAKAQGADAVVSADWKHHLILEVFDRGDAAVTLTHYASENYGFYQYYEKMRRQLTIPCEYYTDRELL